MARLWEDGFDHYGTGTSSSTTALECMLDGSYANADHTENNGWNGPVTAQVATGTHSFYFSSNGNLNVYSGLRKVLPSTVTKLGMMARFYFPSLPGTTYSNCICHFLSSASSRAQLSFYVDTNGAIRIVRGHSIPTDDGTVLDGTLLATTDPLITASAWNHVEIQANIADGTSGWVRIAINGIHRYELTGVDTAYDSTGVVSVGQNRSFNNSSGVFYMDDYVIYDFTGNSAVDTDFCPSVDGTGLATSYIGELMVWPLFPNGDTAEADWAKSTGTVGEAMIDETTPNDTDYIYSTVAGDLSEFDIEDLPPEITYIRGLSIHARMSKSDAGTAMIKLGMKSVAATSDAAERPLTVENTYWRDMVNVDPNSGSRWTRTSLNAAWLRLTRSA